MDNQAPPLEMIFGNYMAWKLDEKTWVISFMEGTEYLYLLEGEEKALLLDTGYGKRYCSQRAGRWMPRRSATPARAPAISAAFRIRITGRPFCMTAM